MTRITVEEFNSEGKLVKRTTTEEGIEVQPFIPQPIIIPQPYVPQPTVPPIPYQPSLPWPPVIWGGTSSVACPKSDFQIYN